MKRWHILLGSSFLVALSAASACGDSSSDAGGAGGTIGSTTQAASGSKAVTGSNASTKATAVSGSTSPASSGSGNMACGMLATYGECVACFCEANEAGCTSYFEFEDAACLCDAGTPCVNDCGTTYCAGEEFMGACETCYNALTGMEMCFETALTNCQADATCSAYLTAEDAECGALPE